MTTHHFETTSEAYDACQCDESIADGDVLVVASERVVGVLVAAWPVAITAQRGAFHALSADADPGDLSGEDYSASFVAARGAATEHNVEA